MINSLRGQLRCAEKERGKGAEGVEGEIWRCGISGRATEWASDDSSEMVVRGGGKTQGEIAVLEGGRRIQETRLPSKLKKTRAGAPNASKEIRVTSGPRKTQTAAPAKPDTPPWPKPKPRRYSTKPRGTRNTACYRRR